MTAYTPGLHILAVFDAEPAPLQDCNACRNLFDGIVRTLGLSKVGEVYHAFPEAGFTATVCLTESHASIHTWPEFGRATFDVFLSNYQQDNSSKARQFYDAVLQHFGGTAITVTEVFR